MEAILIDVECLLIHCNQILLLTAAKLVFGDSGRSEKFEKLCVCVAEVSIFFNFGYQKCCRRCQLKSFLIERKKSSLTSMICLHNRLEI